MSVRCLECGGGNLHIVGPCPYCESTKGGLLVGTIAGTYKGLVMARCAECGKGVDYYVDAHQGRVWKLEEIEVKRGRTY